MLEHEFVFTFQDDNKICAKHPVPIPLSLPLHEVVARIVTACGLPCYVEDELAQSLQEFVTLETDKFFSERAEAALRPCQADDAEVEMLVSRWCSAFTEEHISYAHPEDPSPETSFSEMYHTLIHSPALDTILNLEHTYAMAVGKMIRERDETLSLLQKRQLNEMEAALKEVGITIADKDINELAARHFEENQRITEDCDSKITSLKITQQQEFREWVTRVHEDFQSGCGSPGYLERVRAASELLPVMREEDWNSSSQRLEESFTIHLGSQLKMMHNLRLLSADVMNLCRDKPNRIGGVVVPQPQRLQTAMSLCSNNLCGLVLLVDNRINTYMGNKREFATVCQQSTEFHFPGLEEQLEAVREHATRACKWRSNNPHRGEGDNQNMSRKAVSYEQQNNTSSFLRPGDFYITRHSNLAEVHVVFHMVIDDSLRSSDITSRHPVILGLRNTLRVAHERDICTITLPLLLVHEMSEEMTISWCLKRAELVFKCVKGFMIEMASLGGEETHTVQFLVPREISEDLFSSLSSMLSTIFRTSNPVILKSR